MIMNIYHNMKKRDLRSILLVEEKHLDELFDIMNETGIKISKIKDFEYLFTNEFIYSLTRELVNNYFDDLKDVTEYMDNREVIIFLSDCPYDLFYDTNVFYVELNALLV